MDNNERRLPEATGKWFSARRIVGSGGDGFTVWRHASDSLESTIMHPGWSALKARVSNRLARHLCTAPFQLPDTRAMVSFTFDDVPKSAATVGAPMLEEYNAKGTFYISGGLVDHRSGNWTRISVFHILVLHLNGHQPAPYTFPPTTASHP